MSSAAPQYGDPETRRRILQAAWELLEAPDADVSLSATADRARVSRQAVYLHFGDRSGLLVALVDFIDETLGRTKLREYVHGADTGVEGLRRWVETMSWYTAKIDRVTQVLELGSDRDAGLSAAWRDRMDGRRDHIRRITERIAAEGWLADGWAVPTAIDLIHAVTMPGPWRELTQQLGWTSDDYAERVWELLRKGLLRERPRRLDRMSSSAHPA